jgi:hypothetical protein
MKELDRSHDDIEIESNSSLTLSSDRQINPLE